MMMIPWWKSTTATILRQGQDLLLQLYILKTLQIKYLTNACLVELLSLLVVSKSQKGAK